MARKIGYLIGALIGLILIYFWLRFYLPLKAVGWGEGFPAMIGWGISAIITLIIWIYLRRSYSKTKFEPIKWLARFIGFRFGFFVFLALSLPLYLLTKNAALSGISITLWWICIFLSFMMPPSFFCYFRAKNLRIPYQTLMVGLGVIAIAWLIKGFEPVIYDPATNSVFQAIPLAVGKWLYPIGKLLVMIPAGTLFLSEGLASSGRMRIRSLCWAFGFFAVGTTIFFPAQLMIYSPVIAGAYCSIADILFGLGIYFRPTG